jgi:predicted CoA-binding protein
MKILLPDGAETGADPVADVLQKHKTIAVVGLSSDPMRPSHGVAAYLQDAGYRIIPVNPNERKVLGEKSYARVEDVPEKIEIIDIFRRPEEVPPAVDGAIRAGAQVVWMQLGIVNDAAAEKARAAGLTVIMDACMLIEHKSRKRAGSI